MTITTNQRVHMRLAAGPATCAEIAESLGKVRSYMAGRMADMFARGDVTRQGKPAVYSNATDMLPADRVAIAMMLVVYGEDKIRAAVEFAIECKAAVEPFAVMALEHIERAEASEETAL